MAPRKTLGEIFAEFPKKVKNADKVEWLRANAGQPLFYLLTLAYRDDVPKFLLPEGAPPFKEWKGRPGSEPSELLNELKRLYIYLDGQAPLRQFKRELLFQTVLEALPAADVRLLIAVKDKKVEKEYRLPRKVVDEAFPGLLTHPYFNPRFIR